MSPPPTRDINALFFATESHFLMARISIGRRAHELAHTKMRRRILLITRMVRGDDEFDDGEGYDGDDVGGYAVYAENADNEDEDDDQL